MVKLDEIICPIDILRLTITFGVKREIVKYLNKSNKKDIYDKNIFNEIYKHQPELKNEIDNHLKENDIQSNFALLFLKEFENKIKLKSIIKASFLLEGFNTCYQPYRKNLYKKLITEYTNVFIELHNALLSLVKDNNKSESTKDDVLYDLYFSCLKLNKIKNLKLNVEETKKIGISYNGDNEKIMIKILDSLLKLNHKNEEPRFFIDFFKDWNDKYPLFNISFHEKMKDCFGDKYDKISDFSELNESKIKKGYFIEYDMNYKYFVQQYGLTKSQAIEFTEDIILIINDKLKKNKNLENKDINILPTKNSLVMISSDKELIPKIESIVNNLENYNKSIYEKYNEEKRKTLFIKNVLENYELGFDSFLEFNLLNIELNKKEELKIKKNKI